MHFILPADIERVREEMHTHPRPAAAPREIMRQILKMRSGDRNRWQRAGRGGKRVMNRPAGA